MLKKLSLFIFVLLLAGCSVNNPADAGKAELSFEYQLISLIDQAMDLTPAAEESRCIQNLTGKLTVISQDTGIETEYTWYGKLNYETFEITSNKTIILQPGTYDFILELKIDNYQYIGSVSGIVVHDGANVVPLSIYSIIGDVTADFTLTQLSSLRFVYPTDEFQNIARPRIGYIIDGKKEILISFDKNTGITETYFNLLPGNYNIKLKFYDGNTQIGKSVKAQESVTVALKQNIVMDIVPLHAETTFALTHEGGTAVFNFIIPGEVVDEVGGTENLITDFRLYSAINGYKQELITLNETAGGYTGSISFDQFQYDTVSFAITFIDARDFEVIGASGKDNIELNCNSKKINLLMELLRRAVVSGHLLAVLGIHVIDANQVPVNGVSVYINDKYKGITGSAPDMTKGYLKVYQEKGDCLIKVVCNGKYGTASLTVDSLEINNIEIMLDKQL